MARVARAIAWAGNYKVCPLYFLDPQGQPFPEPSGCAVLSPAGEMLGGTFADATAALAYARGLLDAEAEACEESEDSDAPRPQ